MVLESTVREGKMPKPGFKSITISEQVYEKFYDVYEKNKEKLTMKGVNSFAGYITYMLEDSMLKAQLYNLLQTCFVDFYSKQKQVLNNYLLLVLIYYC